MPWRRLDECTTTTSSPRPSSRRTSSRRAAGRARGEEVVDDLDRAVEVEHALGFALERLGHGGDRVRRGQRVLDGGRVAGVVAEQRRVRAVQRRDHAGLLPGREHRAREDRGGGVRHGVVDVEHVEAMIAAHLGHAHRQRQGVVGKPEQLVLVDRDGMEVQARRVRGQAERPLVGDEVHVVPARRQVLAERGRQHAAAAHRRVARDADAQRVRRHVRDDARRRAACQPESSVNASSDRSMSSRRTYAISGASSGRRYACSPAPVT